MDLNLSFQFQKPLCLISLGVMAVQTAFLRMFFAPLRLRVSWGIFIGYVS
jgi:hypothetical protein